MPLAPSHLPLAPSHLPLAPFLDWILAALPLLVILLLMLGLSWGGAQAGPVGWLVALLTAALRFGAGWEMLAYAQLKGVLLTLFVLYIIWAALLFYRVADEAGAVTAIGAGLPRLTADRALQALLLGWVFSAFLQGVSGFGVPVAVIAPLLIGLGFPAVAAAVIPSVGHSWAVTFGSLASSFYALMAATGRSGEELAPWAAVLLGLSCFGCGAGVLWAAGGPRTLWHGLVPMLVLGAVMSGVQFLVVIRGLWPIGGMLAGLAGLAVGVAWARGGEGSCRRPILEHFPPAMPLRWALFPYGVLVAIIILAQLMAPVRSFLGQVVLQVDFPELVTARGWVVPAGPGRTINLFGHAGALLCYAAVISFLVFRRRGCYPPGVARRIARDVVGRATGASIGIASMVGMAVTMDHVGMVRVLAEGMTGAVGVAFPFAAPFIGALGAFVTGSNTNSNVLFGGLQQDAALLLGVSPLVILAAQTTGGAIGGMFAPAKVIVGSSTVGAGEGPVMRKTLTYGLVILTSVGAAAWAAVYLLGLRS